MYNEYNTLSTAEYNDSISDAYDDYLESWFTPRDTPKVSHEQETEEHELKPIYALTIWKRDVQSKNARGYVAAESKDRSFKELLKLLITAATISIPLWKNGYKVELSKSYDYPYPEDDTDLPF